MREFETGATRDDDQTKPDYEGFLSPLALRRYGVYMSEHRTQADGKVRDSDNWQKGMPVTEYLKSMWRHFLDLWTIHRGTNVGDEKDSHSISRQEALCGIIFNAMGYLHVLETNGDGESYAQDSLDEGYCNDDEEVDEALKEKTDDFRVADSSRKSVGLMPLHRNQQGGNPGILRKKEGK